MSKSKPWIGFFVLSVVAVASWFLLRSRSLRREPGATPAQTSTNAPGSDPRAPTRPAPTETAETASTSAAEMRTVVQDSMYFGQARTRGDFSPIAAASVSWTTLVPELCDHRRRLLNEDFEPVRAVTVWTDTDASGAFHFERAPEGADEWPSAVWISAVGFRSDVVVLSPGAWSWPPDFALEAAACIRVLVRLHSGEPVAGALVRQHLHPHATFADRDGSLVARARKLFLREAVTGGDGTVCMPAAAPTLIWTARAGELRAPSLVSVKEEPVELELFPTFTLEGVVEFPLDATCCGEALVRAGFRDAGDASTLQWASNNQRVRDDGSFGPCLVPCLAQAELFVELSGSPFVDLELVQPAPRPGEHVRVRLSGEIGTTLGVRVRETSGEPLPSVRVIATVAEGLTGSRIVADTSTDPEGRTEVVFPLQRLAHLEAWKEGWILSSPPAFVPALQPRGEDIELVMTAAGSVRGRVLHAGEPVAGASVFAFRNTSDHAGSLTEVDAKDGSFELGALAPGRLTLFAYSESLPRSDVHVIGVEAGATQEVLIELPSASKVRGRIVDGRTGVPVPTATIQLAASVGGDVIAVRGDAHAVDANGRFELDGYGEGTGYGIRAPGYAPSWGQLYARAETDFDAGDLPLQPLVSALLRVLGDPLFEGKGAGTGYAGYAVHDELENVETAAGFDAEGHCALTELRPGRHRLALSCPDGSRLVREIRLQPGQRSTIDFDRRGRARVRVKLLPATEPARGPARGPATGAERARGGSLRWVQSNAQGERVVLERALGDPRELTLARLSPGRGELELAGADGRTLAHAALELRGDEEREVELSLSGSLHRVRLVDRSRAPLAGVPVEVRAADATSLWRQRADTNAHGEIEVGPTEEREIRLNLNGGLSGRAYDVRARLSDEVAEVVLDLSAELRLRLVDGDQPLPGAHVVLVHRELPPHDWTFHPVDREGRVRIDQLQEDDYEVIAWSSSVWPDRFPVRASAGALERTLPVRGRGDARFTLRDRNGSALANAALALELAEGSESVAEWVAAGWLEIRPANWRSDADGIVDVRGLRSGRYIWRASASGGAQASGELTIATRRTSSVEARLE